MIQYKGINYDIGTTTTTGGLTRETFDINIVAREIAIIKNELHCNAIRISGLNLEWVVKASEIALGLGLTVWFSPSLRYGNQASTLQYIIDGAAAAERLRTIFSNLIFVVGCELSLFTAGFIAGDTGEKRLKNLFNPVSFVKNMLGIPRSYNKRLNKFLAEAVAIVRGQFHGQLSYASGTWEKVNWDLFDITGIDHYRSSFNKTIYRKELQAYIKMGKPVSIMEFGCCTYKGAEDKGPVGWAIVDWKKKPPELKGNFTRDEGVQAKYLLELLSIFADEDVFAAFAFTFVSYNYLHKEDPRYDLDMAAYGIVKAIPISRAGYQNLPWIPKLAFFELGRYYDQLNGEKAG